MALSYLKRSEDSGNQLVHLKQRYILSRASPSSRAERKKAVSHLGLLLRAGIDPPLGSELGRPRSKHALVSVNDPCRTPNNGASGDETAISAETLLRHNPLERKASRRVTTQSLVDHGAEVGQVPDFIPLYEASVSDVIILSNPPGLALGGQLGQELVHGRRVSEQVVEDGPQRDGRRVRAREHVRDRKCKYTLLTDELWVFSPCVDESQQEVPPFGAGSGWLSGDAFLDLVFTVCHAFSSELDHGRVGVEEIVFAHPQPDRVLEKNSVQYWQLPDLASILADLIIVRNSWIHTTET